MLENRVFGQAGGGEHSLTLVYAATQIGRWQHDKFNNYYPHKE